MPKKASPKKSSKPKVSSKKAVKKKAPAKSRPKKPAEVSHLSEEIKLQSRKIGVVSNYFEHVGVAALELDKPLKVGDKIRVIGGETDFEQKVESMQIDRKPVKEAKKGDDVGIKLREKVRRGYRIFKV